MEGINIINKTPITDMTILGYFMLVLGMLIICCTANILSSTYLFSIYGVKVRIICGIEIIIGICMEIFAVFPSSYTRKPTDIYQYECTLDDSASFNEVLKKYDIVEQKGDIWILKDKEIKK